MTKSTTCFYNATLSCKKSIYLLLIILSVSFGAFAQTSKTVTGRVVDEKNAPVNGASIQVKNNSIGTATDAAGKFSINVPVKNTILVISS